MNLKVLRYGLIEKFQLLVRDKVSAYLSLKVEDFCTTPSQELELYWSNKSWDELALKLKVHESNQQLKKMLERENISLDEVLSCCKGFSMIEREGVEFNNS